MVKHREGWAAWHIRCHGTGRLWEAYQQAVRDGRKPVRVGNVKGGQLWREWTEVHTVDEGREWQVVRIKGPHRTIAVAAADPRTERTVAHAIRTAGGRAEAVSSVAPVGAPAKAGKRKAHPESVVRRMWPRWSGHMRAALGSQRADPGTVGQEEEWDGPTADDEEMERDIEGWLVLGGGGEGRWVVLW